MLRTFYCILQFVATSPSGVQLAAPLVGNCVYQFTLVEWFKHFILSASGYHGYFMELTGLLD